MYEYLQLHSFTPTNVERTSPRAVPVPPFYRVLLALATAPPRALTGYGPWSPCKRASTASHGLALVHSAGASMASLSPMRWSHAWSFSMRAGRSESSHCFFVIKYARSLPGIANQPYLRQRGLAHTMRRAGLHASRSNQPGVEDPALRCPGRDRRPLVERHRRRPELDRRPLPDGTWDLRCRLSLVVRL